MKYLLYIDILGFSKMVSENYAKVNKLFNQIDRLNVHEDESYQTVIFSDTILIFNKWKPTRREHHEEIVMFLCEFAQDLLFRCISLEVQFRAILTYDKFFYKERKNFQSFYGNGLINAYVKEKEINAMGLFIEKKLTKYMFVFKHQSFDDDLSFVYLTQNMENIKVLCPQNLPLQPEILESIIYFPDFKYEVRMFSALHRNILTQYDPKIKGKYIQTYNLYKTRYKYILEFLEKYHFDPRSIIAVPTWFELPLKKYHSSTTKKKKN